MPKKPRGTIPTKPCPNCEKAISKANLAKHLKKCKGKHDPASKSEVNRRYYVKNRQTILGKRRAKIERTAVSPPPRPAFKIPPMHGDCPILLISKHEDLYLAVVKYLNEVSDRVDFLSKQWIRKALMRCHPDKLSSGQLGRPKRAEDYALWNVALSEFTSWLNNLENGTVAPSPRFSDLDLSTALEDARPLIRQHEEWLKKCQEHENNLKK